jgi:hypothetical protein
MRLGAWANAATSHLSYRTWPTVSRDLVAAMLASSALAAALLSLHGDPAAAASVAAAPDDTRAPCDPQTIMLPSLGADGYSAAIAVSDSGWVAGVSSDGSGSSVPVVWRDATEAVSTDIGGVDPDTGRRVIGSSVDVNESGLVAINRATYNKRDRSVGQDVVLWSESGGAVRLPTTSTRPRAYVTALNDHGVAAGMVRGKGHPMVPVVWRNGKLQRLPIPHGTAGTALDINNSGRVVGYLNDLGARFAPRRPWTWRIGGSSGPLKKMSGGGPAALVNDAGRIVGAITIDEYTDRSVLWRSPAARPRRFLADTVMDLHNSGYLAVTDVGFRGFGAAAYVGHLRDGGTQAVLPEPPNPGGWDNVVARSVGLGVTAFAPQGGVTIVGSADDEESAHAVLWTCAQTHM